MIHSLVFALFATIGGVVELETTPPSDEAWVQQPSGIVSSTISSARVEARQFAIEVRSAVSGKPLAGALAWLVPAGEPVPLFARSSVMSSGEGILRIGHARQHLLRVAAPGHEMVHLAPPYPETLILWPAKPRSVRLILHGEPVAAVRIAYALDASPPSIESVSDAEGRVTFPYGPREGIRVELIDDRFAFASLLLDAQHDATIEMQHSPLLRARVLDSDGRPVARAEAVAWVRFGKGTREVRKLTWTADDEGGIAITNLAQGPQRITFRAQGFMSRVLGSDDPSIGSVVLRKGRPPVLRVVGPSGPLDDAVVFDREYDAIWTAEADGTARLEGLDAARRPLLRVTASNHLSEEIKLGPKDPPVLEVRLRKGASLRVRLLDAARGGPVSSIRVRLTRGGEFSNATLSRDDGEYEIAGFQPGPGELLLWASGFLPLTISFDAPAAGLDLGTIFLSRGASVEGTLVSATTGNPLAGASIAIPRRSTLGSFGARFFGDVDEVIADVDGRFTISGLEGGIVCGTTSHPLVGEVPFQASVEPGTSVHLGVVTIGSNGSVSGRIVDDRDDPVDGVAAELRAGPLHSPCATLRASVEPDGSFRFPRVAAGRWHLVAINGRRFLAARQVEVADGASTRSDVRISFVEVVGSVTLGGEPARGGSVTLKRTAHESFVPPTLFVSYQGRGLGGEQQAVSDIVSNTFLDVELDGSFHHRARLDGGDYEVAFMSGWSFYYDRAHLAEGQTRLEAPLRFDGHRLAGWILDPAGALAGNVAVHLEDQAGNRLRSERSGPDGAFAFAHAPEGVLTVRGRRGDLEAVAQVEVRGAREDLALTLAAPVSPSITVTFDEDEGVRIETVYVTDGRETWRSVARGSAPAVRIPFLRPRRFRLLGTDAAGGIHLGPEVLLASNETSVTFETGRIIRASVGVDAERAGELVQIRTAEGFSLAPLLGMSGRSLAIDNTGTVDLPPLSEGVWVIGIGSEDPVRIELDSDTRHISLE